MENTIPGIKTARTGGFFFFFVFPVAADAGWCFIAGDCIFAGPGSGDGTEKTGGVFSYFCPVLAPGFAFRDVAHSSSSGQQVQENRFAEESLEKSVRRQVL